MIPVVKQKLLWMSVKEVNVSTITFNNYSIDLKCDCGVGIGGDKWPAATKFCGLISQQRWFLFFSQIFDSKSVIELGSGTGTSFVLYRQLVVTHVSITTYRTCWPSRRKNLQTANRDTHRSNHACPVN